jgi:hypothetical protein
VQRLHRRHGLRRDGVFRAHGLASQDDRAGSNGKP